MINPGEFSNFSLFVVFYHQDFVVIRRIRYKFPYFPSNRKIRPIKQKKREAIRQLLMITAAKRRTISTVSKAAKNSTVITDQAAKRYIAISTSFINVDSKDS